MILLNSVLVATDFGETSRAALNYGRNLARSFGGVLHILHVVDAVVQASASEFYPIGTGNPQTERVAATARLDALLTADDRVHLGVRPVVRVSADVSGTIVEYAKQTHVDVIVVGTHGRGPVGRFLMGSVAEHVVRNAPCPVLVVRANERDFAVPDLKGHTDLVVVP